MHCWQDLELDFIETGEIDLTVSGDLKRRNRRIKNRSKIRSFPKMKVIDRRIPSLENQASRYRRAAQRLSVNKVRTACDEWVPIEIGNVDVAAEDAAREDCRGKVAWQFLQDNRREIQRRRQ